MSVPILAPLREVPGRCGLVPFPIDKERPQIEGFFQPIYEGLCLRCTAEQSVGFIQRRHSVGELAYKEGFSEMVRLVIDLAQGEIHKSAPDGHVIRIRMESPGQEFRVVFDKPQPSNRCVRGGIFVEPLSQRRVHEVIEEGVTEELLGRSDPRIELQNLDRCPPPIFVGPTAGLSQPRMECGKGLISEAPNAKPTIDSDPMAAWD